MIYLLLLPTLYFLNCCVVYLTGHFSKFVSNHHTSHAQVCVAKALVCVEGVMAVGWIVWRIL